MNTPLRSILLASLLATPIAPAAETALPRVEAVFVLDTTGSMGGLIQSAKEKIWDIVQEMRDAEPVPALRLGLIGYRDRGDAYITRLHELSEDTDAIYADLLAFRAEGGGDTPESVNQALHEAVTKMDWTEGGQVYRVIFLVGDAPPKMEYDELQYPDICKLAEERDIIINAVQCGNLTGTREIWQEIAQSAGGTYAAIRQDGGTEIVRTPYDEEIDRYNGLVNSTIVLWGDETQQASGAEKVKNAVSGDRSVLVARASYNAKFGGASGAISGNEDLVAEVRAGRLTLSSLKKEELPAALREMPADELQAHLNAKAEEREGYLRTVRELVEKRDAFLRKDREEKRARGQGGDAFDVQVREQIRLQGAAKGIGY